MKQLARSSPDNEKTRVKPARLSQLLVTLCTLAISLSLTSCSLTEWGTAGIIGDKFRIEIQMPKPFRASDVVRDLGQGYSSVYEHGYTSEGSGPTFQIKVLELHRAQMERLGLNRRGLFEMAKAAEIANLQIADTRRLNDEDWPAVVSNATEMTLDSADGKTTTYLRVLVYSSQAATRCSVMLKAVAPKSAARPAEVERFFNSFKIVAGSGEDLGPEFTVPIQ
jgi:hypothetical protein